MKYVWDEIWQDDSYGRPSERTGRAKRRLAAIAPHLQCNGDLGDVLELGCGDGSFANCLSQAFDFRVTSYLGLDLSPTAVGRARSTVGDRRFKFELADLSKSPFAPSSADTIFVLGVLEHLFNASDLLASLQATLRPNGRLILTTSNRSSLVYVQRRLREILKVWPYGYQHNYTHSEIRTLLSQHFTELAVEPMHSDWDFPLAALVDRAAALFNENISRYILAVVQKRTLS